MIHIITFIPQEVSKQTEEKKEVLEMDTRISSFVSTLFGNYGSFVLFLSCNKIIQMACWFYFYENDGVKCFRCLPSLESKKKLYDFVIDGGLWEGDYEGLFKKFLKKLIISPQDGLNLNELLQSIQNFYDLFDYALDNQDKELIGLLVKKNNMILLNVPERKIEEKLSFIHEIVEEAKDKKVYLSLFYTAWYKIFSDSQSEEKIEQFFNFFKKQGSERFFDDKSSKYRYGRNLFILACEAVLRKASEDMIPDELRKTVFEELIKKRFHFSYRLFYSTSFMVACLKEVQDERMKSDILGMFLQNFSCP